MTHDEMSEPMYSDFDNRMLSVVRRMKAMGVMPLVTLSSVEPAQELARLLVSEGMAGVEVTFRSSCAPEAIAAMRSVAPDLLIAAGTVLTHEHIDRALAAGADMVVSPGLNPDNVLYCQQQGFPIIPGVNNPTHIEQALGLGLQHLKFFPADTSGGVPLLKALAGPFPDVLFMPTGGITIDTFVDYLGLPTVFACGGSWILDDAVISAGNWTEVRRRIQLTRSRLAEKKG